MATTHPFFRVTPRAVLLVALVILVFAASHIARVLLVTPAETSAAGRLETGDSQRVVALSPSTVEILYQLDLDDRLVGISRFCKHPPEVREKPVVGGYLDLDFEMVLALAPDCVVLLREQALLAEKLNHLGIGTIVVNHSSTRGIIDSMDLIGERFGKSREARQIVEEMNARISRITRRSGNTGSPPRVLVCIDRDSSSDHPERVVVAGSAGFHRELITMCGGMNAYQGQIAFPMLSREKLIGLDPDIIIELVLEDVWHKHGRQTLLAQWAAFGELQAVRNKRVYFLHDDRHMIPGPRFVDTLEQFARAIIPPPGHTSP